MAKGYWIARVDVTDPDGYQGYVKANAAAFSKFGARFIVRGGQFEAPEGTPRARNVVLEFADYATARGLLPSRNTRRRKRSATERASRI